MATELEELVIRLTGESAQFQAMMKEAVGELQDSADEMKSAAKETESFKHKLEDLASTAASAFAAIGLGGGLRDLLHTWSAQEDALVTLNAAIQVNERNVEGLFEQYQAFASSMQAVTTTGDEVTLSMLQQAESFGVTGDAAMRAARNAISLGAAVGMSAQAAMRMTVMLEQGNTMMLTRYIPSLRNITDEGARVAEAHRVLNNMFAVAQARAGTTSGRMQQLANTWGDLKEELGKVVAIGLIPFVRWLKMVVDGFHALDPETKRAIATTVALTMAITGLSVAVRVASALFLLLQRRLLLITLISAGIALLIQHFGGLEAVMGSFENAVNDALGIDPQAAFSANNQAFAAGMGLGENLTAGLKKGSEGVEGILLGSAAAAGAIFSYVTALQSGAVPSRDAAGVSGLGLTAPKLGAANAFRDLEGSQKTFWQTLWAEITKYARQFWDMLPPWAQSAIIAVRDVVAQAVEFWRMLISQPIQAGASAVSSVGQTFPASGTIASIATGGQGSPWNTLYRAVTFLADHIPPPRQHGGPVMAGSPYIVGEDGPELFMPNVGGQIIPTAQLSKGSMGGVGGSLAVLQLINDNLKLIRRQKLMVGVGRIG